jgi:hypothetical protein
MYEKTGIHTIVHTNTYIYIYIYIKHAYMIFGLILEESSVVEPIIIYRNI